VSVSASGPPLDLQVIDSDEKRLNELGYKQELQRGMGSFSNFAVSFTIISIITGVLFIYVAGQTLNTMTLGGFALAIGILVAIYTTEFAPPAIAHPVRFVLDILNGVPTIVTGIFVYGLIVVPQGKPSGFAASIALAIVMLPIVARTAQEVLALVPSTLTEAAHALGIARWRTTVRIKIPTAAGGLITGSLLAVARVAGETAPLLLCNFIFQQGVHSDPGEGLASIPLFIFQSSEAPSAEAHTQAWAAALVLIAFVLVLNIVARAFYARSRKRMGA